VLLTTAATGEGVPQLLDALDRHRATARDGVSGPARLARAEAQVWAIVGERLRERLRDPDVADVTRDALAAVADHRLDPYTAADRLILGLTHGRRGTTG
jgi:LAO/AO transport system kinase